ncbi:ATP-dependent RNA helicase RhlB [Luteibacter rhizovicinus DSM 16549]|uniref:ATP-dependent RNA helicase RhlB n=1 Tax=Luteibacter rhizovicinus DSM 16549 TaxID=1440763 RepID=A0A0G9HC90_9GAMM|nr:DEAD/DEAH box helicase [Luteibacter rhizovicinus]APG03389.1 ATP-dependent RNA helicase RhlB [Luteibacter rhizovicinus DSM 16549]KLD65297.1 ATP-dependent RNA helicase RhlB [Luteibacter rhizovicinus DSM 16549]KLD80054.1 ATP-dependent RNA helicase RhlB [Xanthomonas hyacinthi DSM 19077]
MSQTVLTDVFYENLDLHPLLHQGLAAAGITRTTPIQALTLPVALLGRDVAGQAQTGTGKTFAFLVALMNRLLNNPAAPDRKDADPRALIIAPTRELAIQIEKDFQVIGKATGLRSALIYGGVDYDKQRQQLRDGCDIIIATPGRLLDYYKQDVFGFGSVEVMVIDEADRMFDLGFIKDVRFIFRRLPAREKRQVLLFSATLSHRVLELAYEHMHEAEKLVVETENVTADRVRQVVYFPSKEEKMPLLLNLLEESKTERSIIFVNTKAAAERITDRLKRHNFRVGAISGDVPQVKRQKLLQRFQDGQIDLLVATDVAARGLHIPAVSHVFNYDLPQDAEDYVHRIGRTARLGAEGDAISFACDLYAMGLPDIETYINQKIPTASIEARMLVMPAPRPRADGVQDEIDDPNDNDGHIPTRGAPPEKGGRSGSRDGRGGPRSGERSGSRERSGSGERRPRTPRPDAPAAVASPVEVPMKTVVVAETVADLPAAAEAMAAEGAPKKRRRRGGRGRGAREGVENGNGAAVKTDGQAVSTPRQPSTTPRQADGQGNPNRRPSRQVAANRPSANVPAPAASTGQEKVGFFRRIGRLFGGR